MAVTRTENVIQFTRDNDHVEGKFIVEAIQVEGLAKSANPVVELEELATGGTLFKQTLNASGGSVLDLNFPLYHVSINADGLRLSNVGTDWFWFYMWVYCR